MRGTVLLLCVVCILLGICQRAPGDDDSLVCIQAPQEGAVVIAGARLRVEVVLDPQLTGRPLTLYLDDKRVWVTNASSRHTDCETSCRAPGSHVLRAVVSLERTELASAPVRIAVVRGEPYLAGEADWPMAQRDAARTGSGGSLSPGPQLRWRVREDIAGLAPIVVRGLVCGASGKGLRVLDGTSGEETWRRDLPLSFSSPTYGRGYVYLLGARAPDASEQTVYALDVTTRTVAWQETLPGHLADRFVPVDRFLCVLARLPSRDTGVVYCLDAESGSRLWSKDVGTADTITAGSREIIAAGREGLCSLDLATGGLRWRREQEFLSPTQLTIADGRALVSAGQRLAGGIIVAYRLDTGEELWRHSLPVGPPPPARLTTPESDSLLGCAVSSDAVVLGDWRGMVTCLDPVTSSMVWESSLGAPVSQVPVIAGTVVVAGADDGTLWLLDRKTGKGLWTYQMGAPLDAPAAVSQGFLYAASHDGFLYAFGPPLPSPSQMAEQNPRPRGTGEFVVARVTVRVLDHRGRPVPSAPVKAFSEDWAVKVPHSWFAKTDAEGRCVLSVTVGSWSFYVGADYPWTTDHPGEGLFLTALDRPVTEDCELVLRPSEAILLQAQDPSGQPRHTDFWAMVSARTPMVLPPFCGFAPKGVFTLHVNHDDPLDVLSRSPTDAGPGMLLLTRGVCPGEVVLVRPAPENAAYLDLAFQDAQGRPVQSWVDLNHAGFSFGENTGLFAQSFEVKGRAGLYVTPGLVQSVGRITEGGWRLSFAMQEFRAEANRVYQLRYGGAPTVAVHTLEERTQIWTDVVDAFGNTLISTSDPEGKARVSVSIMQDGEEPHRVRLGEVVGDWNALVAGSLGRTSGSSQRLQYVLDADLGPLGAHRLSGDLYGPGTLMQYEEIFTPHFRFRIPAGDRARFGPLMDSLEKLYAGESAAVGYDLKNRCTVTFEAWLGGAAGTAGLDAIYLGVGYSLDSPHHFANSTYLNVAAHELGHVFIGSPPSPGFPPSREFNEPFATLLGYEGVEAVVGERAGCYQRGTHDRLLQRLLDPRTPPGSDRIEEVQFLLFYLRKHFGLQIHRNFLSAWNGTPGQILRKEKAPPEIAAFAIYSHLAGENLGWLARLAGFPMSDGQLSRYMGKIGGAG